MGLLTRNEIIKSSNECRNQANRPYETFEQLDIRLGRIISIERATEAPKPSYVIKADFGKYGVRTSVGRFTNHSEDELKGMLIFGVLNFEPRIIGGITSEFLTLGVQFQKPIAGRNSHHNSQPRC